MSIDDLTAFFARLQEDTALQDKARAVSGAEEERLAAVCKLAAAEGFTVTPEDLRSEQAKPAAAALDDGVLQQIVGGGQGCTIPGALNAQVTPMG
jgi:predicted ribosomally synthesized peptide with nif11-like leader